MPMQRAVIPVVGRCAFALLAPIAVAASAAPMDAQHAPMGRIEGTVTGTVRARSADASLTLTRLDADSVLSLEATVDERGHYRFDSLPAGRYMLEIAHVVTDSLGLSMPAREILVVGGETARPRDYLPSATAMRDAMCRGVALREGRAAVSGHVVNADTDRPLGGADVVVAWTEAGGAGAEPRVGAVQSDARGEYTICDVPSDAQLTLQPQYAERAGPIVSVSVARWEGVVTRDLVLSATSAPTFAILDSIDAAAERSTARAGNVAAAPAAPTGTASVTGTVRDELGAPVGEAEVRLSSARAATRTDDRGRYVLAGLPAGHDVLAIRRIGYAASDVRVDLRAGRSARHDVQLARVASLDSVRVLARPSPYEEFERSRRNSPVGTFLSGGEIARYRAMELGAVVQRLPGFTIVGGGAEARVYSNPARSARPSCEEANVVVDGVEHAPVNFVAAREVAGLAAYAVGAGAPAQYGAECGLIVVWTKRYAYVERARSPR